MSTLKESSNSRLLKIQYKDDLIMLLAQWAAEKGTFFREEVNLGIVLVDKNNRLVTIATGTYQAEKCDHAICNIIFQALQDVRQSRIFLSKPVWCMKCTKIMTHSSVQRIVYCSELIENQVVNMNTPDKVCFWKLTNIILYDSLSPLQEKELLGNLQDAQTQLEKIVESKEYDLEQKLKTLNEHFVNASSLLQSKEKEKTNEFISKCW